MYKYIKSILFACLPIISYGQNNPIFTGGIGDGAIKNVYSSSSAAITSGGNGAGSIAGVYSTITQEIRIGGIGDGSTLQGYQQLITENKLGGVGDGTASSDYNQAYTETRIGSIGEGSAASNYFPTYQDPRVGGDGEGSALNNYLATYNEVRRGDIGDGYASLVVPALPLTPLPLSMLSFTGSKVEQGHQLKWLTANEKEMSHFVVERSANGFSFDAISNDINVKGNAQNDYSFIDEQVLNGSNYYRLRIYDAKGKFTFSNTILLTYLNDLNISLYPNPTADVLNIVHSFDGACTIQVLNLSGQVLQEQISNSQIVMLDLSKLPSANYFVKINNKQKQFLYKIAKR